MPQLPPPPADFGPPPGAITCASCGELIGAAGGRCPRCGAEQVVVAAGGPAAPPTPAGTPGAPPSPAPRFGVGPKPPPPAGNSALLAVTVFFLAAAAGVAYFTLRRPVSDSDGVPAASSAAPAPPAPAGSAALDPAAADVNDLLFDAQRRAAAWAKTPRLVSIEATSVRRGRADGTAGVVRIVHGRGQELAQPSGAPLPPGRHVLTLEGGKVTATELPDADDGPGVDDPTCVLSAAWRTLQGLGAQPDDVVELRYGWDRSRRRALWQGRVAGSDAPPTLLDGDTCAVVARGR